MKLISVLLYTFFVTNILAADTTIVARRWSPLPTQVSSLKNIEIDLNGRWLFNPAPMPGFEKEASTDASWKPIEVPGEWVMQGFSVEKGKWAGYTRIFTIPESWKSNRLKLRCDAIYSESEIYIDGKKSGYHLGGFTPFEIDITALVTPGKASRITIKLRNESTADAAANGSKYAVHPLGGITRKIKIIPLPEVNISQFHAATIFDKTYTNATLKTEVTITNESQFTSKNNSLLFELLSPTSTVVFSKKMNMDEPIPSGSTFNKVLHFEIAKPKKWDPEHPTLYTYRLTLNSGRNTETTERRIGFRQIEVRGNQVFVNNHPIKLRGVCRHEAMPLRGRSVAPGVWAQDVKIFRNGNVNYIRTSHYPPPEELVAACDSLGMFLEIEAPFCWADRNPIPKKDSVTILQIQTLDMVNQFRSQPSVLMWSMGNESKKYKEYFSRTATMVKRLDPTRPRIFSQWAPTADGGSLEIANHHYPGPTGPDQYHNASRPTVFDEYVHINAYNRLELVTDPGIRDAWGIGFAAMWDRMYHSKGVLGGAIWGGIDDTFVLGDTTAVGYGTWGVIDGWRREKPEYWHMKKAYSPVKISQNGNWEESGISFTIENQHLFSNINECRIQWQLGNQSGTISPSIDPGATGKVTIACKKPASTEKMILKVYDPRNILIDAYVFKNLLLKVLVKTKSNKEESTWKYNKQNNEVVATSKKLEVRLHTNTGNLKIFKNGKLVSDGLAELMVLPLNKEGDGVQMTGKRQKFPAYTPTAQNKILTNIIYETKDVFTIEVWVTYTEAKGYITYAIKSDGTINVDYRFNMQTSVNPRQWGLVFCFPATFNTLSWEREGIWNYYPDSHIGRIKGVAQATNNQPEIGAAGPLATPQNHWSKDRNEWGTNDFRSTKMNVLTATLSNQTELVELVSDGTQHVRNWIDGQEINLLVAQYSNLGTEAYFRNHAKLFDKPLIPGDELKGSIHFLIK